MSNWLPFQLALAEALRKNPRAVMLLESRGLSLKYACSIPFIEPDAAFVDAYRAAALNALAGVSEWYLQQDRKRCEHRLRGTYRQPDRQAVQLFD